MQTIDLRRELATLYRAGRTPALVDVPSLNCLMVDGQGDPNTSVDYREAVEALFTLSWTLRFALKHTGVLDHRVMPLEGLWWTPDMAAAGKKTLAALDRVRLERWTEGPAAQVLHVGPYNAEEPTIAALHAFIHESGLELTGKHHEIYLGDPRRAAADRLRTIIRQPVTDPT